MEKGAALWAKKLMLLEQGWMNQDTPVRLVFPSITQIENS